MTCPHCCPAGEIESRGEKLEAARSALAWVSGEGQRNCTNTYFDIDLPGLLSCPERWPDDPELWCDVCVTGAALYSLSVP